MSNLNSVEGMLLKAIGGLYYAETPLGVLECKARGIFRKQNISPCAGDKVIVTDITGNKGVVDKILPRKNSIIRPPLANLDYIVFVTSTCEPAPNLTLLDKFLAIAQYKNIKSIIAVTKLDLQKNAGLMEIYMNSGAEFIEIDYDTPNSYMKLYDMIAGKITAFTGNTGVGKSTLLNHIVEDLDIKTGEISQKLGRGRHTTRNVELYKLDNGGYIADTPGFSTFETQKYDIIFKDKLAFCFPEFDDYTDKCRFPDCAHIKEKGCAVIEAVNLGEIPSSRHNSYVEMYEEAKQIKEWEIKNRN
ncbi:MAG: ribosome small subunit-dependent GTPase A [Oscillospiraceae bacterium]|nr:ribosome small subunit-dependent GTPase A [Oscillospiraceae bacterium]